MPFDLLHFGSGIQAVYYFILCLASILGTIQGVATRYKNCELVWLDGNGGYWLGGLLVAASMIWFLLVDDELFIPGLAGGELFAIFAAAFIIAIPITRLSNMVIGRLRVLLSITAREEEMVP